MSYDRVEVTADLLGLIYETAHDPTFWPLLLDGLNKEFETVAGIVAETGAPSSGHRRHEFSVPAQGDLFQLMPSQSNVAPASTEQRMPAHNEQRLAQRLVPHFRRALALNREYADVQTQRSAAFSVFDQVPIGVLFVTGDARIVIGNERATAILKKLSGLREANQFVVAGDHDDTERLHKLIADASAPDAHHVPAAYAPKVSATAPQSVLVVPYSAGKNAYGDRSVSAAVLIATPEDCTDVSEDALIALFGLTKKEALLAKSVASGMTLKDCEDMFHVTHDTLKSQLKSIFGKTGVARQSEMVRMILTSPAVFAGKYARVATPQRHPASTSTGKTLVLRDDTVMLPDGRRLGFAEYGDPEGIPVMLFHGTYGCRTQRFPDDALTHACGVRLIVPERPGFGVSSVHEGRTFLSWARDVACFADQLGIDRFAILGHDAGGCYACACALAIPERLINVIAVNSLAPFESLSEYQGIMPNEKLFYALAHYTPTLFARFAQFTLKGLANSPKWYLDSLPNYLGESDLAVLRDERIVESFKQMIIESARNSVYGFAQDMALIAGTWDFDPAEIRIPVHVWHGRKNVHVPFTMGERLARRIPTATLRALDNEGHFTIYKRWRELLELAIRVN